MKKTEQDKKKKAEPNRKYQEANNAGYEENRRKFYAANKEQEDKRREDYEVKKKKREEKGREHNEANKEEIADRRSEYYEANKEDITEKRREYNADPANMEKRNKRDRDRRKTDPAWAIQCNLSSRLGDIMRGVGVAKQASTMKIVGCTRDELIAHLASKFKQGMTMENQGSYWHVDHIMPCAAFDHNIPAQVRTCWHYTNLQPLEAKENMRKGCKITVPQMSLPLSTKKDAEK